jgi:hypothetical protein
MPTMWRIIKKGELIAEHLPSIFRKEYRARFFSKSPTFKLPHFPLSHCSIVPLSHYPIIPSSHFITITFPNYQISKLSNLQITKSPLHTRKRPRSIDPQILQYRCLGTDSNIEKTVKSNRSNVDRHLPAMHFTRYRH